MQPAATLTIQCQPCSTVDTGKYPHVHETQPIRSWLARVPDRTNERLSKDSCDSDGEGSVDSWDNAQRVNIWANAQGRQKRSWVRQGDSLGGRSWYSPSGFRQEGALRGGSQGLRDGARAAPFCCEQHTAVALQFGSPEVKFDTPARDSLSVKKRRKECKKARETDRQQEREQARVEIDRFRNRTERYGLHQCVGGSSWWWGRVLRLSARIQDQHGPPGPSGSGGWSFLQKMLSQRCWALVDGPGDDRWTKWVLWTWAKLVWTRAEHPLRSTIALWTWSKLDWTRAEEGMFSGVERNISWTGSCSVVLVGSLHFCFGACSWL